jgi:hypothetical protein
MWYIHSGILLSLNEKEGSPANESVSKPGGHYAK